MADDRTIEKKDRNVNEPIQFYTGRGRMLYELVVWTVDKNKITGYLSTPKGAPQPVQTGPGALSDVLVPGVRVLLSIVLRTAAIYAVVRSDEGRVARAPGNRE